jgi:hypothetical protein
MKKRLAIAGLVLGAALPLFAAGAHRTFADQRDFRIENDSYRPIYHLYISPSNSNYWGSDWLGPNQVIAPFDTANVHLTAADGPSCYFDVLVQWSNGDTSENDNLNLCALDTLIVSD